MSLAALLKKELRHIARLELQPIASRLRRAERSVAELRRLVDKQERAPDGRRRSLAGARGRRLKLSPARRAALRLQGQYMGYLRALKPRQKATVKAARAARGIAIAIRLARGLAKS